MARLGEATTQFFVCSRDGARHPTDEWLERITPICGRVRTRRFTFISGLALGLKPEVRGLIFTRKQLRHGVLGV